MPFSSLAHLFSQLIKYTQVMCCCDSLTMLPLSAHGWADVLPIGPVVGLRNFPWKKGPV